MIQATRYQDALTHRSWLEFAGRPPTDVIEALKSHGWRWSGYRKAWHHPSRSAQVPMGLDITDGGEVHWAEERAERLEARAGKLQQKADARLNTARRLADSIPLGQPILVGHHSEKHARRDAERIHNGFAKGFELQTKAQELTADAAASIRHQAHLMDAGTIKRRIDKLRAELRKVERNAAERRCAHGYTTRKYPSGWQCLCLVEDCTGEPDPESPAAIRAREYQEKQAEILKAQIAEEEKKLADAGGIIADKLDVKVGDVVNIKGHIVQIERINPKTYSGVIIQGGAFGMHGKWDKSELREILVKEER